MQYVAILTRREGDSSVRTAHGPSSEQRLIAMIDRRREQDPALSYELFELNEVPGETRQGYASSERVRGGV